jgi:DNA invertase Pin-like site-specific DNA recombinase
MKIIAYYRVSTKRQGKSGLGLDAQRATVLEYAKGNGPIVAEYTDIESGNNNGRPQLALALKHARGVKGKLVIAKLDRLARNVAFTAALMESGVDFVACDNPHATKFTIHILAAVAELERQQISERTKLALAAAKRRGVKLGASRPDHPDCGRYLRKAQPLGTVAAAVARKQRCEDAYGFLMPEIEKRRNGGESLAGIATWLNDNGHCTTRNLPFTPTAVHRLLAR